MRWSDLEPDAGMLRALNQADAVVTRREAVEGRREPKHKWANAFADACAQMIADELRRHPRLGKFEIRPRADGTGKEARTFVAAGTKKQVDVIVATLASGLQMGFSLKGLNFVGPSANYDHNLTGRTYELQDEVRAIHEYQAAAFMVAIYFLPLLATEDKTVAPSSFARTVAHLRARTGRLDHMLVSHARRCDAAAVALYAAGDPGEVAERGVVRFVDVMESPPRRGRPRVETTLNLPTLLARFCDQQSRDEVEEVDWAEPES